MPKKILRPGENLIKVTVGEEFLIVPEGEVDGPCFVYGGRLSGELVFQRVTDKGYIPRHYPDRFETIGRESVCNLLFPDVHGTVKVYRTNTDEILLKYMDQQAMLKSNH